MLAKASDLAAPGEFKADDTITFTEASGLTVTATDIESVVFTDTSASAAVAGAVTNNVWKATGHAEAAAEAGTADTVVITLKGNYSGTLTFYVTSTTDDAYLAIVNA